MPNASAHSESRMSWFVSKMKLENVVNAPMKPTRMTVLVSPDIASLPSEADQTTPKRRHPIALTVNVPRKTAPVAL